MSCDVRNSSSSGDPRLAAGKSRFLHSVQQPAPSHTLGVMPKCGHGMGEPRPLRPQSHSHTRVSMQKLFLNKAESVPLGRRRLHSSYLPMGPQQCSNIVITQPFFSFCSSLYLTNSTIAISLQHEGTGTEVPTQN